MPGIPTKFVVADLVFAKLRESGVSSSTGASAALPFAYLGVEPAGIDIGAVVSYCESRFRLWRQ